MTASPIFVSHLHSTEGFPGGSVVKNPPASAGDVGLIPGSGRSAGGENGNPLQDSCLEYSMDRGAWRAAVHGVTKSQIRLTLSLSSSINPEQTLTFFFSTNFPVLDSYEWDHIIYGAL